MLIAPRWLSPRRRFLCSVKNAGQSEIKDNASLYMLIFGHNLDAVTIRKFTCSLIVIAHQKVSCNSVTLSYSMWKPSVGIAQKIDFGGRPCESCVEIPGEEIDYQAIMLLLNRDEWQIDRCLIVFRSPKLGSENNTFLNEPIKNSFGKICQSVLTWVRCNIPKAKELKGAIICKFHVRNHEVCDWNAKLVKGFALSTFCCDWNAPVICRRNLIAFVLFIWFSQVFAYGPVTVF